MPNEGGLDVTGKKKFENPRGGCNQWKSLPCSWEKAVKTCQGTVGWRERMASAVQYLLDKKGGGAAEKGSNEIKGKRTENCWSEMVRRPPRRNPKPTGGRGEKTDSREFRIYGGGKSIRRRGPILAEERKEKEKKGETQTDARNKKLGTTPKEKTQGWVLGNTGNYTPPHSLGGKGGLTE